MSFPICETSYGGSLRNTRRGRAKPRPLSSKRTMHLVLRSTRATGAWSFATKKNRAKVHGLLQRFAERNGVRVLSYANVGNHLHVHLRLRAQHNYFAFIRGFTSALALAISGHSRWHNTLRGKPFWSARPFSRIVGAGKRAFDRMEDYIRINQREGAGEEREVARANVEMARGRIEDKERARGRWQFLRWLKESGLADGFFTWKEL